MTSQDATSQVVSSQKRKPAAMKRPIDLRISAALRRAREARNMSQDELAGAADLGIATIKRAEAGTPISTDTLKAMCSALKLNADDVREEAERSSDTRDSKIENVPPGWHINVNKPLLVEKLSAWSMIIMPIIVMISFVIAGDASSDKHPLTPGVWINITFISISIMFGLIIGSLFFMNTNSVESYFPKQENQNIVRKFISFEMLFFSIACIVEIIWLWVGAPDFVFDYAGWPSTSLVTLGVFRMIFIYDKLCHSSDLKDYALRMPEILTDLEIVRSKPFNEIERTHAYGLIQQALDLAFLMGRSEDARPLLMFGKDLHLGLSSRTALRDYLKVAEITLSPTPVEEQRKLAAKLQLDALTLRTSGLA